MLSLSLTGLLFYPALIVSIAMMAKAYRENRYNFIIMLLLFGGSYGMTKDTTLPIKAYDICLIVSVILAFIFIKAPIVKRTLTIIVGYGIGLLIIASFSAELMSIQLYTWRNYIAFILFIIPIVVFSRKEFSLHEFWIALMPYVLLACIFYIIDGFILCGNVMMPATAASRQSTFFDPLMSPFSFHLFRKYPPGLFPMVLVVYPVAKYYKLRIWQWAVIFMGLMASLTFTVITGFFAAYIFFRFGIRRLFQTILIGIMAMVAGYFIDGLLPEVKKGDVIESKLRIKSGVDQFFELMDATDDEDIAQFASGRMAQILPKIEIISDEGRQLTGLGFLHPERNTVSRYVITNEYYSDISENEEVAALVEVIPVQIYISTGWLGLILHVIFLILLYLLIRRLKESAYFISVIFCCVWFGLGGFCGLIYVHGLLLAAVAFSAVILNSRSSLPGFPKTTPQPIYNRFHH